MNHLHESILLVEDNPDDAELTKLALSRYGLDGRVTHVSDGMQALDYLYCRNEFQQRTGSNPSLVLLDLKMPLLDGIGVLQEIKNSEALHNIPVVILTSSTEPSDPTEFSQFLSAMKHVCEFWVNINQTAPSRPGAGSRNTGFGDLV